MKTIKYLFIMSLIVAFAACSSPYKALTPISSFEELNYSVKKIALPKAKVELAYTDEGSGKTIIFIHGLGSYLPAWKKNVEVLKQNYRCIAIDLPGYGKSSKEPHSGKMTYYASVVSELIEELKLGSVTLAGHSMGGQISITAALLYPEMVNSLILAAPAGFEPFTNGQRQWFRDVMTLEGVKLTSPEAIQNNLATNFYKVPADADFMISDRILMRKAVDFEAYCYAVVQSVNGMVDEPVIKLLDKISQPTLIVFGEKDNLIPNRYLNPGRTIEIAKNGASKIKNSQLIMAPKAGHFVMYEAFDLFNSEVQKFLN